MKPTVKFRDGFLFVVEERNGAVAWLPVRQTNESEAQSIGDRPLTEVDSSEGTYVDEEGNVYQLADKGKTKPIAVEDLAGSDKTELETSLKGGEKSEPDADSKGVHRRVRENKPRNRHHSLKVVGPLAESANSETSTKLEVSRETANGEVSKASLQLNLRQKLAEVRRRIGYVQKRGHNELFNYSYVTAADIAGSVGDLLSELGVVVIPRLENITYESAAIRGETTRMARVVMAYTFADVDSREQIVTKVAGQGLDPGDKAPYKAMTGALKYALLQSFLLASGDDPENERTDGRSSAGTPGRLINIDEIRILKALIGETETDVERVLAYYKVAALEEMTEATYRRALEVLNRKVAQRGTNRETVHAQD